MIFPQSYINSSVNEYHHSLGIGDQQQPYPQPSSHQTQQEHPYPPENTQEAVPINTTAENVHTAPYQQNFQLSGTAKKIKHAATELFKDIKDFWENIGKRIIKGVKILIGLTSLFVDDEVIKKIRHLIITLGLTSLINLGFEIADLVDDCKDLKKDVKLKDHEGMAWSSADIVADFLGIVDTLISCGTTLDKLINIPFIALFSVVTFPISIALLTYDTIHSVYKLIRSSIEFHQLPKSVKGELGLEEFKDYLNVKVGITEKERLAIENSVNEEYGIINLGAKHNGDLNPVVFKIDTVMHGKLKVEVVNSITYDTDKKIKLLPKNGEQHTAKRLTGADKEVEDSTKKQIKEALINFNAANQKLGDANKKLDEANKKIKRKIKILKSRKINQLSRNVDSRIAKYMRHTRVHMRLLEFNDLLKTGERGIDLDHFLNYFDIKINDKELSTKKREKLTKARQATIDYLRVIDFGKNDNDRLGSRITREEFKKIQGNFNALSKKIDEVIEEYSIDHKEVFEEAASRRIMSRPQESPLSPERITLATEPRSLTSRRITRKSVENAKDDEGNVNSTEEKTMVAAEQLRTFSSENAIAKNAVKDLKKLSIRKLTLTSIKTLTCFLEWIMEILTFVLAPLAVTITKLGFSSIKFGISIFKDVYETYGMHKGLSNPQFFPLKA